MCACERKGGIEAESKERDEVKEWMCERDKEREREREREREYQKKE